MKAQLLFTFHHFFYFITNSSFNLAVCFQKYPIPFFKTVVSACQVNLTKIVTQYDFLYKACSSSEIKKGTSVGTITVHGWGTGRRRLRGSGENKKQEEMERRVKETQRLGQS
jgi:hypothetical protein